jgi:hypothetical protein
MGPSGGIFSSHRHTSTEYILHQSFDPVSELMSGRTPKVSGSSNLVLMIQRSSASIRTEPITNMLSSATTTVESLSHIKINEIPFEDEDGTTRDNSVIYDDDKIEGTYYSDLDIITIDKIICRRINSQIAELPEMWQQIERLQIQLNRCPHDQNVKRKIQSIKTLIRNIQSGVRLAVYQNRVQHLLRRYIEVRSTKGTEFGQTARTKPNIERLRIISQYIEIARNYIPINILWLFALSPMWNRDNPVTARNCSIRS